MTDGCSYEIEGSVWDKFVENDDHIVPHPIGKQVDACRIEGDFNRKRQREAVGTFTKKKSVDKDAIQGEEETHFGTLNIRKATMLEKGTWSCTSDGIIPASRDTDAAKEVTTLAADRVSDNCFNNGNMDITDNDFLTNDPIFVDKDAENGNLCHFSIGNISATNSELNFFNNEHEHKESSDLLYYGWPDIGNFEDVDKLFRSCDSTFGQGNTSNDNELSWFSTSHAIENFDDALESGLRSLCSESSMLKSTSNRYEADMMSMHDAVTPHTDGSSDKKIVHRTCKSSRPSDTDGPAVIHLSHVNWLDSNDEKKRESKFKEHVNKKHCGPLDNMIQEHEINEGTEIKISPLTQTSDESTVTINQQRKQLRHQNSPESQSDDQSSKYSGSSFHGYVTRQQSANVMLPSSTSSALQVFPSREFSQQKQNLAPDPLSYLHTCIPHRQSEYKHCPQYFPFTPTTSNIKSDITDHNFLDASAHCASNYVKYMETSDLSPKAPVMTPNKKIEKLCRHRQIQPTSTVDPVRKDLVVLAPFTDQLLVQKQMHQIQDEIGPYSEVDGISTEAPAEVNPSTVQESSCLTSLSQEISLEATNFRQLQYVLEQLDIRIKLCIRDSLYRLARSAEQRHNFGNSNGDSGVGTSKAGESDKFTECMDMETNTNPIDRSVAHLLFHKPLNPSTGVSNDAMSFESPNIELNQQIQWPEKLVWEEEIAAGANTKLQISD